MQTRKRTPSTRSTPSTAPTRTYQRLTRPTLPTSRLEAGGTSTPRPRRRAVGSTSDWLDASGTRVPRLNVTEAERLCYSRRKLRVISALRTGGMSLKPFGLHKDYRVPGVRGNVYLLPHQSGSIYAFHTLDDLHRYAAVCQVWRAQPNLSWAIWWQGPPAPEADKVVCVWPECGADANHLLEGQGWCHPHARIYEQMLLGNGRQVP